MGCGRLSLGRNAAIIAACNLVAIARRIVRNWAEHRVHGLQPLLRLLVAGRSPLQPLFPALDGGYHTRAWLLAALKRFCRDAGVPAVCVHALKGTAGKIADHLSHESERTTQLRNGGDRPTKS